MIRWWAAAAFLLFAACGGDDGDGASATTPPPTEAPATTSSISPSTSPTTSASTSAAATSAPGSAPSTTSLENTGCAGPPAFDPAGTLRQQFVDYLVGCGFTGDEAGCLFDALDFEDPAVAGGDPDALLPAFDACGIDQARIDQIGRL